MGWKPAQRDQGAHHKTTKPLSEARSSQCRGQEWGSVSFPAGTGVMQLKKYPWVQGPSAETDQMHLYSMQMQLPALGRIKGKICQSKGSYPTITGIYPTA